MVVAGAVHFNRDYVFTYGLAVTPRFQSNLSAHVLISASPAPFFNPSNPLKCVPSFAGVAVLQSPVTFTMYWRSAEILETLNPAMKLGRGNGGFREIRNLVLES
jgi:hypothetical protein